MNQRRAPWTTLSLTLLTAAFLGGVTGYRAYEGIPIGTMSPAQWLLLAALVTCIVMLAYRVAAWLAPSAPRA